MTASREKAVATLLAALRETAIDDNDPGFVKDTLDLAHLLARLRQPTPEIQQLVSSTKALRPLKRARCLESMQYIPQTDGKVTAAQIVKHLERHQPPLPVTSPSRRRELLYNARRTPGQEFFFEKLLVPKKQRQGIEIAPIPWTSSPPLATTGEERSDVEKVGRDPEEARRKWEEWRRRKDALARAAKEVEKAEEEQKERCCARKELTFEKWMKEKARQEKESAQRQRKMIEERRQREMEYQQEKKKKLKQLRGNILHQKQLQRKLHRKNQIKARLLPTKGEGTQKRGIPYLQKLAKTPAVGKVVKPKQRVLAVIKRIRCKVEYKTFASMLKKLGPVSHPELVNRIHATLRARGLELLREDVQTLALALPRTEKRTLDFSSLRKLWRMCKDDKESVLQPESCVRHEIGRHWSEFLRCAKSSELQAGAFTDTELEEAASAMLITINDFEMSELLRQNLQLCCKSYCSASEKPWSVHGLAKYLEDVSQGWSCKEVDLRSKLFNFFDAVNNTADRITAQDLHGVLKAMAQGDSVHLTKQVESTIWLDLMIDPTNLSDLEHSSQTEFTREQFAAYWESRRRTNGNKASSSDVQNDSSSSTLPSAFDRAKARKANSKAEAKIESLTLESAWEELKGIDSKDLQIYGGRDRVPSKRGMAILGCLCLLLRRPCTLNTVSELFDDWENVLRSLDSLKVSDFTFLTQEDRDKITQSVSQQNLETFIRQNEMAFFGNILRCIRIVDKVLPTTLQDVLGKLSADAVQSFTDSGIRRTSRLLSNSEGQ